MIKLSSIPPSITIMVEVPMERSFDIPKVRPGLIMILPLCLPETVELKRCLRRGHDSFVIVSLKL